MVWEQMSQGEISVECRKINRQGMIIQGSENLSFAKGKYGPRATTPGAIQPGKSAETAFQAI